jgi:excisionase family DNA binding protein
MAAERQPEPINREPLMSVAECAEMMHRSKAYAYKLINEGVIPATRLEDGYVIRRAAFEDWLYNRQPTVRVATPEELAAMLLEGIGRLLAGGLELRPANNRHTPRR